VDLILGNGGNDSINLVLGSDTLVAGVGSDSLFTLLGSDGSQLISPMRATTRWWRQMAEIRCSAASGPLARNLWN
jgi:hypothetical protein